jgi:hypothetical protein
VRFTAQHLNSVQVLQNNSIRLLFSEQPTFRLNYYQKCSSNVSTMVGIKESYRLHRMNHISNVHLVTPKRAKQFAVKSFNLLVSDAALAAPRSEQQATRKV